MVGLSSSVVVGVIGAGTMGAGIAQVAAKAGHDVLLYDAFEGAAQKGLAGVDKGLSRLVERNKMSRDDKEALLGRIRCVDALEDLSPSGLVIEVIVENLDIKQKVFAELEEICGDDTILATNTSSISITSIAAKLKRPERLVGMHFFNPAPIMKLVEVVSGLATSPKIAKTIYETAQTWGKQAVFARSTPGFIVNRVARPFYGEALRILQEGACDVATIDGVMREAGGFRMGPFELMDLIGHDVNFAVTKSVFAAYFNDQRFLPSLIQQELVEAGRLGRKSSMGFYDYREGHTNPAPHSCEIVEKSFSNVVVKGETASIASLIDSIEKSEMTLEAQPILDESQPALLQVGQASLVLSDGRYGTVRSKEEGIANLITFDLALDYGTAQRIALSKSDQASDQALEDGVAFFQSLGKSVTIIEDTPGMIVMRTLAMLVNEGCDAVHQQVCSIGDVDVAMKGGVNYPAGPLEWADRLSVHLIADTLKNLADTYGEDRYRTSPLIKKMAAGNRGFYSEQISGDKND